MELKINLGSDFLSLCAISAALADTPANCTYEDIEGAWIFHAGHSGFDNTIDCQSSFEVVSNLTVKLSYPDIAVDEHGNKGFWTLIYNQGFEVVVAGRKYFAFSMFSEEKKKVVSYCHRTSNGWSHDLQVNNWACYYGVKANTSQAMKSSRESTLQERDLNRKYVKNLNFINKINSETDLWEASHYPELEEMSLRDRLRRAGGIPKAVPHAYPRRAPVSKEVFDAVKGLPENLTGEV